MSEDGKWAPTEAAAFVLSRANEILKDDATDLLLAAVCLAKEREAFVASYRECVEALSRAKGLIENQRNCVTTGDVGIKLLVTIPVLNACDQALSRAAAIGGAK